MTDYIFDAKSVQKAFPDWTKSSCVYLAISLNIAYKAGLVSPPQNESDTVSKLVPNCIGRLDDLVNAIRNEEYFTSAVLLNKEVERVEMKAQASYEAFRKDDARRREITNFRDSFSNHEFRQSCTKEVGG